jgi:hypothetical protein
VHVPRLRAFLGHETNPAEAEAMTLREGNLITLTGIANPVEALRND